MELLIAGGIALAGYNLSGAAAPRPRREPARRAAQLGPSTEYAAPGNGTLEQTRAHVAAAAARWEAARDPALTGVVNPNTVRLGNAPLPYFRSAKSQNTNDAVKQTRLEAFTGATGMDSSLTGTYRSKREVDALFRPGESAAPVTSAGSAGNRAVDRDLQRFEPGVMHNNVLPSQQVTVGRGVGVGPDVAATDGFHPMLRIPVKNVGDYKKNNLEGRVNHGAAPVTNTASQAAQPAFAPSQNAGALVYGMERRPLQRSRAAVLAPSEIPEQGDGVRPARVHGTDHFGNPARAGPAVSAGLEARHGGRDNPDRNHGLPNINLGASSAGVGAFASAAFDPARLASCQREQGGGAGFLAGPKARAAPTGHLLPATQRDMTCGPSVGPAGGAASHGQAVRHGDAPRATLRDTQGAAAGLVGVSAAVKGGAMDNVRRYRRLGREATKRQLVSDYAPQAGRAAGLLTAEAQPGPGSVALRGDDARRARAAFLPTLPNATYQDAVGSRTTPHNKLPTGNPRLQDLDLAAKQLQANPYARSLWTAA